MSVKYKIMAKTGEDRNGKAFYSNIGVVLQGDKGFTMKLGSIPVGWDGFAFFADPEQQSRPTQQQNRGNVQRRQDDMDDDIPF